MFNRIVNAFSQQATSFVLAAMVTVSMLGGIDQLASPDHDTVAQHERTVDPSAQQVVVITAKRLSHS